MLYIGIDLGTSAVKLLLMNEKGEILNIATKEYELFFPQPGWSEQKAEDWITAVIDGVKELTAGFDASQVAGIGAGGQMHGLVAWMRKITCFARQFCGTTAERRLRQNT